MSSVTSVPAVRQIFAFSGILRPEAGQKSSFDLIGHAVSLAPSNGSKRVCYLPTAVGEAQAAVDHMTAMFDDRAEIEFSVLRLFTQPSVPDVRAHLTSRDVLLVEGGSVANLMAIWRVHGLAEIMRECWDAGVDFDGQARRHVYRRLVAEQMLPAGFASEDGVGLHYVGTDLYEAVTVAPGKQAWWVEPAAKGGFRQRPIEAREI